MITKALSLPRATLLHRVRGCVSQSVVVSGVCHNQLSCLPLLSRKGLPARLGGCRCIVCAFAASCLRLPLHRVRRCYIVCAFAAAELDLEAKEPGQQCLPSSRGITVVTKDRDGVAIAAGDAAAVETAAELDLEAKEPGQQCLPSSRGTTVVTKDHDGVAIAAGDAAAVEAEVGVGPDAVALGLYEPGPALRGARAGGWSRESRGGNQLRRAQAVADVGAEIRNCAGAHYGGEPRLEGSQRGALREPTATASALLTLLAAPSRGASPGPGTLAALCGGPAGPR